MVVPVWNRSRSRTVRVDQNQLYSPDVRRASRPLLSIFVVHWNTIRQWTLNNQVIQNQILFVKVSSLFLFYSDLRRQSALGETLNKAQHSVFSNIYIYVYSIFVYVYDCVRIIMYSFDSGERGGVKKYIKYNPRFGARAATGGGRDLTTIRAMNKAMNGTTDERLRAYTRCIIIIIYTVPKVDGEAISET